MRCIIEGKVDNPVDWNYKSGQLPPTPVWADFTGEGVEAPEQGYGPAAPLHGSSQNPGADGSVVDAAGLQRQLQAQATQHQQQMQQLMFAQQQMQMILLGQRRQPQPPQPQQPQQQQPPQQQLTTVTTTTTGPGQRPISAFFNPPPNAPTNAAGIAAALQDPAVMDAIAAVLGRRQGAGEGGN